MAFYLSGDHDELLRLKSFTSATRNGKAVIRIELETHDMNEMAYALKALAAVQAGQKSPRSKLLALPSPEVK